MKNKMALATVLALLSVSFFTKIHIAETQDTPWMYLNPNAVSASPGTSFSVDVVLEDVADLVAWEFKLFWNNSVLECVTDMVHIPPGWENHVKVGLGIEQDFGRSQGRYFRGLVAMPTQEPHPTPFNGNTALATLTFNVKAEGTCILELRDTKLVNYEANPIDHKAEDGYFQSQPTEKLFFLRVCAAVAAAFGARLGDPTWKPFADLNIDGIIDIYDMVLVTGDIEETA